MKIRGTLNDLENQLLIIELQSDTSAFSIKNTKVQDKYDLKGVYLDGSIKKFVKPPTNNIKTKVNKKNKNIKTVDENNIPDTELKGKINTNMLPTFRQYGFESKLVEDEVYLCLYLQKLEFSSLPSFIKNSTNVFCTVEFVKFY
jgi:hypothetical protein